MRNTETLLETAESRFNEYRACQRLGLDTLAKVYEHHMWIYLFNHHIKEVLKDEQI